MRKPLARSSTTTGYDAIARREFQERFNMNLPSSASTIARVVRTT